MKKLLLMRHAKSSWEDPHLSDFDRPLNPRGLKAAPFMGLILKKNSLRPDLIVSSPAKRAKQTAMLVKESAELLPPVKFDERIYEASANTLFNLISETPQNIGTLLLIGHNPGLEYLIRAIANRMEPMPTAALAIIELDLPVWESISPNSGMLKEVIRPKDEKEWQAG